MRKLFTLLLLPAFCHINVSVYAQSGKVITGKITAKSSNAVLSGVTISVKGTNVATQSDANGEFKIAADPNQVLIFRYIGYDGKEVTIGQQNNVIVNLAEQNTALDEIVVIGYGTAKKADLTGAISRVTAGDIVKQPALNAVQSVQGKIAGVNIIANEAPGSAPTVIIRGLGTASGGREPLYIVDGFPVDNITNINSADIVSMDVLKDASSASIYGLRAANGVILVTTKQGKAGRAQITYDGYVGAKGILNRVKMADANEYVTHFNENLTGIGTKTGFLSTNQANNTDWYDELLQTGIVTNNVVSLSGGSDVVDYFFSYNNFTEKGITDGAKYTRNTIRNNNTYKFFDNKLKLSQTLNISFANDRTKPLSAFDAAYRQSPLVPVQYENGRYGRPIYNKTTGEATYVVGAGQVGGKLNDTGNPVYENKMQEQYNKNLSIQGGLQAEYQIFSDLKFTSRLGVTKFFSQNRGFNDIKDRYLNNDPLNTAAEFERLKAQNPTSLTYANNSLNIAKTQTFRWVWENFLSYQKSFGKHNIDATLGNSREKFGIGDMSDLTGYEVPNKSQYWNIDLASSTYTKQVKQTYYTPTALISYFARAQYNYDSKYYLTATVRRDGSSKFKASGEFFDIFPSFGAGWTVSNESFMQGSGIDFLKLRANWGRLGNQNIPLNISQVLSSPGSDNYNYVFGPGQDLVFGAAYGSPARNLRWEVTEETGLGVDFTLLNNRLSGNVDYYNKVNTNAILEVKPLLNSPFSQKYFDHGGKVSNQGVEIGLNWTDQINENLSYSIGGNYSYNKNTLKDVKPAYDGAIGGSLNNGQITKQLKKGQPLYAWYMLESDGVWQTEAEIADGVATTGAKPGYLKYKDQNGDGVIDDNDKVFHGSYLPSSTFGINLSVNYKKWDFTAQGYGVAGNKIYNGLKGTRVDGGENITKETFDNRWTGAGTSNTHPGAAHDALASSYYLESGAYFRINNLTLGYTIPKLYNSTSKIRMYLTAQNPFMFTKYTGFSPEITGANSGNPSETAGIELSAYPTTRNFIFGVNVSF